MSQLGEYRNNRHGASNEGAGPAATLASRFRLRVFYKVNLRPDRETDHCKSLALAQVSVGALPEIDGRLLEISAAAMPIATALRGFDLLSNGLLLA
jgi:hypothetical protein